MKVAKETVEKLTKLRTAMLDGKGREILNPKPLAIPVGMTKPQSLREEIQKVLREEVGRQAQEQGKESWEDANDFDVVDDFDTQLVESKYQLVEEEFVKDNPFEKPAEPEPEVDKKEDRVKEQEVEKKTSKVKENKQVDKTQS